MNLTKRIMYKKNDRKLCSLSIHSNSDENSSAIRAPMTSPINQSSPKLINSSLLTNEGLSISSSTKTTATTNDFLNFSTSPIGDSRIPRPSPTSLHRSLSMRVRGERVPHHSRTFNWLGPNSAHQHHRNNNIYQQSDIFPSITENGVDSPRHRSLMSSPRRPNIQESRNSRSCPSSLSLTPARPRLGHAVAGSGVKEYGLADDSDVDSVKSYGSACSTASACDHAHFALNGTTWSGRSRKYVVHCSNYNGDSDHYLTPTQRAARQVKKFQTLLNEARKEIEEKNREILRLTKELVELRLYKASLNSPDEKTDSSDALTVRENNPFSPDSPCKDLPDEDQTQSPKTNEKCLISTNELSEFPISLADSGHFEDESINSKDSTLGTLTVDSTTITIKKDKNELYTADSLNDVNKKIVDHYEKKIEEIYRKHIDEIQDLKQKHNDKVESLLNQFSEINTRYCELRPSLDTAEAKVQELESELEQTKTQLEEQKVMFNEQEERNKQMYLKMYAKGQEAARLEKSNPMQEQAQEIMPKVTVTELLQQLSVTQAELENVKGTSYLPQLHISADRSQSLLSAQEAVSLWVLATRKAMYRRIIESRNKAAIDPEITLQFLKSAIYYFLTDKENHYGHLNAIESILGFTDNEKLNIDRIYGSSRK